MKRTALLFAFATIAAGCGGGGGGSIGGSLPVTPTAAPAVTPPPVPTPSPFAVSTSVPVTAAGLVTLALPSSAPGFSGQTVFSIANPAANTSITVSYSNSPPGGVSVLDSRRRTQSIAGASTIAYACYSSNNAVALTTAPAFNFTLPMTYFLPGASFWLASYDGTSWSGSYAGPGVVSGTTISFSGAYVPAITSTPSCVALYVLSNSEPAPPTPTATPGILIAEPSSLAFTALGSANAQTISVVDPTGQTTITESDTCASGPVATIAASSGNTYTVTPANAGTCTATFSSPAGAKVTVSIGVTVSDITVQ